MRKLVVVICFLLSCSAFAVVPVEVVTCTGLSETYVQVRITYHNQSFQQNDTEVWGRSVIEKNENGSWSELKTFFGHSIGTGAYYQRLIQHLTKEDGIENGGRDMRLELHTYKMVDNKMTGNLSFSLDGTPIHPETHERFSVNCLYEQKD